MEQKVTIYTLAEKLNMSVSAVSRAFNPNSKLSAEKRKIILEAAEQYGYVQNKMASRLSQQPIRIGVLMRGRIEAYYLKMLDGIKAATANDALVGSVQSVVLLVVTLGTLIYLLLERRIPTHHVHHWCACLGIGLLLGVISSFLGIGGGPINLVVLSFFFSMETKKAAQNSLFIILLSQSASLIFTLLRGTAPSFPPLLLAIMVLAGILGGVVGRRINKRIDAKTVRKLLVGLILVIIFICCYNTWQYCH